MSSSPVLSHSQFNNTPYYKELNESMVSLESQATLEHEQLDDLEKKWISSAKSLHNGGEGEHQQQLRTSRKSSSSSSAASLTEGGPPTSPPLNNTIAAASLPANTLPLLSPEVSHKIVQENNRIKNEFMNYCLSHMMEDEEARDCFQIVWTKYLQSVGNVALLSAFFDTLPHNVKALALPKYQLELIQWCRALFRINLNALICTTYYSESFQRVVRYALKVRGTNRGTNGKIGIIYCPVDFDPNLKEDLNSAFSDIAFEHVRNDVYHEDTLNLDLLQELLIRDGGSTEKYPLMVIASAGTPFLGRCDDLGKVKALCDQHNVWLHATGDLLGSAALLSLPLNDDINIQCDSLTLDIVKLFGIQNLPFLTFFVQSSSVALQRTPSSVSSSSTSSSRSPVPSASEQSVTPTNDEEPGLSSISLASLTAHPLYDIVLHSPSISFLSVWSVSQRCSNDTVLYHMRHTFRLTEIMIDRLQQTTSLRMLNLKTDLSSYQKICSGNVSDKPLPKTVILFRFEPDPAIQLDKEDDLTSYVDLLNLWLFDKLSQQYPKMYLELLKSTHFQTRDNSSADDSVALTKEAHAIRFAPLEHLLDVIDERDMNQFVDDIHRYADILLATMNARAKLPSSVGNWNNLASVHLPNWAGIGGVRYVPQQQEVPTADATEEVYSIQDINTIQAELARKLQANDSAFSLGGSAENDQMLYLRLGMVRKRDDLDVLLKKIADAGKDTEQSLKYREVMAEKIKEGIRKAQKDLQSENQNLLAQDGLLRQLPIVSSVLSWWSPAPSSSRLAMKGRSFNLQSGQIESTENTYLYRMQVQKSAQSDQAPTHDGDTVSSAEDSSINTIVEQGGSTTEGEQQAEEAEKTKA